MKQPLSGYRVIDTTAMVSGPLATMQLADQGAEVLKIERPDVGDYTRLASNQRHGFSASYLNNNRNKRSVVIDVKTPEGKLALERLVATADVFIQNFRPGVAERMGLEPAQVGVKATTNEKLGAEGREEGISCQAVALLCKP